MRLKTILAILILTVSAFASDVQLGLKLYKDGMYELSAKAFEKALISAEPSEIKDQVHLIASVFVKTGKFDDLAKLRDIWSFNFRNFRPGFLAGIDVILTIHQGKPIQSVVDKSFLSKFGLEERVDFFRAISIYNLNQTEELYLLKICNDDTEFKGAIVESGLVGKIANKAAKRKDYSLLDYLFDNYGKWLTGSDFKIEYIKFLERKGRNSEALVELEKLFKKNPADSVRFELARAYYLNGNYKEAIKVSSPLDTKEAKYLRAWSFYKLGDFNSIVRELSIDISKPNEPESISVFSRFLSGEIDPDKIREFYPSYYVRSLLFSFSDDNLPSGFKSSEELFYTGYLFYEKGEFKSALSFLKKAVGNMKNPSLAPATLYLIGRLSSRNLDISSMIYREILNRYPNTPYYRSSLLPAAETFFLQGNFPAALKILRYAREQLKIECDELKKLIGLSYFYMGNYKRAVKELLSVRTKDFEVLNALSYSYFKIGEKKKSIAILREIVRRKLPFYNIAFGRLIFLSKEPGSSDFLKGISYPEDDLLKAMWVSVAGNVKDMKKVAGEIHGIVKVGLLNILANKESSPEDRIEAYSLMEMLAQRDDVEKFAHNMKVYLAFNSKSIEPLILNDPEFIAYNPANDISDVNSLIEKAKDYEESGQVLKAYGLYRLSLERLTDENQRLKVILKLIDLDLKQGNFKKALSDADLIQRKNTKLSDVYNFCMFRIYNYMGKTLKSYEFADKVADINNIPEEYRVNFAGKLASYYKLSGKREKALKLIGFLLEKGLENVDYDDLVRLSIFADKEGKLDDAIALIKAAVKKAKTKEQKVESLFWLSSYNEKLGKEDKALIGYLKIYYEFNNVEPWASTSIYRAAEILEKKGDLNQALKLYRKVVEIKGNTDEGLKAKKKVRDLEKMIGGR
jgi:tetratricopeptide (TPR) repeat protein